MVVSWIETTLSQVVDRTLLLAKCRSFSIILGIPQLLIVLFDIVSLDIGLRNNMVFLILWEWKSMLPFVLFFLSLFLLFFNFAPLIFYGCDGLFNFRNYFLDLWFRLFFLRFRKEVLHQRFGQSGKGFSVFILPSNLLMLYRMVLKFYRFLFWLYHFHLVLWFFRYEFRLFWFWFHLRLSWFLFVRQRYFLLNYFSQIWKLTFLLQKILQQLFLLSQSQLIFWIQYSHKLFFLIIFFLAFDSSEIFLKHSVNLQWTCQLIITKDREIPFLHLFLRMILHKNISKIFPISFLFPLRHRKSIPF